VNTNPRFTAEARSGLEARFGLRVAALLEEGSRLSDHVVDERLRVAREQAMARARAARAVVTASETSVVAVGGGGVATLSLGGSPRWWFRLASALPLLLLIAGLVMIDDYLTRQQMQATAEFDNALLADDLPPAAYSDPAFVEFLRSDPQ
jgi:hypothetical protein